MSSETLQKRIAEFLYTERERLVGYVRRLIDDTAYRDGEDIVQDVILNIYDRADITIPIENLSAYIYQALRNRVIDYMRKRRDVVSLDAGDDEDTVSLKDIISDPRYNAFDELKRKELRRRIFDAIESLNDKQKAVVIETEFANKTFKELSEEWGVPIGTLLARKSRALSKIRETLYDIAKQR